VRAVGIDLGERRIGIALSDASELLASPLTVLDRSGDEEADRAAIAGVVADAGAGVVVVGVPRSLSGAMGPAARAALAEVEQLARVIAVPVETHDERLTTALAVRLRREGQAGARSRSPRAGGGGSARRRARSRPIDSEAAAVMLQSWLDGRRNAGGVEPEGR
jgi:putative holliday junction resolvase